MYQTTTGWLLHALYLGNTPVNSDLVHWNLSHMNYLCSVVCEFLSFACSPYHDIHIIICVLPHKIFVNVIGKNACRGTWISVTWGLVVVCELWVCGFGVWGVGFVGWVGGLFKVLARWLNTQKCSSSSSPQLFRSDPGKLIFSQNPSKLQIVITGVTDAFYLKD